MKRLPLLLALTLPLSAPAADDDRPRDVSIDFTVVSWEALSGVRYPGGGAEITLPAFSPSPVFHYKGPPDLRFFRRESGREVPFAGVALPPGIPRFLLLFASAPEGGVQVLPLPASGETFPIGHARIFNATSAPVAVKCPSGVFQLEPAGFREVTGNGRFLRIEVARKTSDSWEKAFNSMFELHAAMRRTIFITANAALLTRSSEGTAPSEPLQVFTLVE